MRKGNELTPASRVKSIHHHLRMLNGSWTDDACRQLCACVSELAKIEGRERNRPNLPRVQAMRLGLALLAQQLCREFACVYKYPDVVEARTSGLYMRVPFMKTVPPYDMHHVLEPEENDDE